MSEQNEQQTDRDANSAWEECEPGTLGSYGLGIRLAERRATLLKASGTCAVAVCLMIVCIFSLQLDWTGGDELAKESAQGEVANFEQGDESSVQLVGLACGDVMQLASGFFDQDLTAEQVRLTKQHLRDCPKCRQKYMEEAKRRGITLDIATAALPTARAVVLRSLLAVAQ